MQTEEKETEGDRGDRSQTPVSFCGCRGCAGEDLPAGLTPGRPEGGDRGLTPVSFGHTCGEESYLEDTDTQRNTCHGTDDAEG